MVTCTPPRNCTPELPSPPREREIDIQTWRPHGEVPAPGSLRESSREMLKLRERPGGRDGQGRRRRTPD